VTAAIPTGAVTAAIDPSSVSTSTAAEPVTAAGAMCATASEVLPAPTIASNDLVELSGLASGRRADGVYWAHNDSGDTARVFATDLRGDDLATYTIAGADAVDWEDIASGPAASRDASELYLGDIGDNARSRTESVVYRVREPAVDPAAASVVATLSGVEKITLHYPDGPHDAETLMVDSVSGDMITVTKDIAGSEVFRVPGTLDANATATLELVARIDFGSFRKRSEFPTDAPILSRAGGAFATGGDITPAGDVIAIRTYSAVWLWSRSRANRSTMRSPRLHAKPRQPPSLRARRSPSMRTDVATSLRAKVSIPRCTTSA
jgi:hypothetical protein